MMCLGWRKMSDCKEQTVAPCDTSCPSITWFWAGAVGVALALFMGPKKKA